jgi:hypothetical protein
VLAGRDVHDIGVRRFVAGRADQVFMGFKVLGLGRRISRSLDMNLMLVQGSVADLVARRVR